MTQLGGAILVSGVLVTTLGFYLYPSVRSVNVLVLPFFYEAVRSYYPKVPLFNV